MSLKVRRELKLDDIKIVIEPEADPEEDFLAYIGFGENDDGVAEYVLPIRPDQWQNFKDLVDETFRHMQTYVDRLPKDDQDEE